MERKHSNQMTKKEFLEIPSRGWTEDIGLFNSIVIIPGYAKEIHDSGYRCMDFVACDKEGYPIKRLSGYSDVLHIDGITGWGKDIETWKNKEMPTAWSIDCLPKSGLLRLFPRHPEMMECGLSASSFEIFAIEEK